MEIPIKALRRVKLDQEWLSDKPKGLLDRRLSVNPDDPTEGVVWTQWSSLDQAKAFADRVMKSKSSSLKVAGRPKFYVDPEYLERDRQTKR